MKRSEENTCHLKLYRAWNNAGFDGYILASSSFEAKNLALLEYGSSCRKAFIFNVEPVEGVTLTEIE